MHAIQPKKLNEQLFKAINQGNEDKVKELIKEGADVNAPNNDGNTPLYRAIMHAINTGQISIIKALIESGADVNAPNDVGHIPLYSAIINGQINITKILLTNGADVNAGNVWIPGDSTNRKVLQASALITPTMD